ncbi:(Fe-S)-binding protein, partial [uncultured Desulfovibrio sp.]
PFQGLFIKKDNSPQNTACVPMFKAFIGERHIPMLSKKTLSAKVGTRDTPAGKSGLKVAFFPGCMGDKIYTDMAEACLKVFEHHGVGVYMPDNQACCGIPALTSGDLKSFGKLSAYNLDLFAQGKFDYIVTPCSSCTATIKEHWQNAEDLTSAQRAFARTLGEKAMDINAFLVDVLKVTPPEGAGQGKIKVTYHESCHLMKSLRVSKQPKDIIKMNKDYQLVPMKEADHCCGCGGTFTLTQPELSAKIGQRKRDNIVASGAEVVAMGCPACMMQISDMLARNHDSVKVKHTIEIYADSLS